MKFRIDVLANEPIVQAICLEGFKLGPDMVPMIKELRALLDTAPVRYYIIFDLEHASFGLDDIIATANIVNQPELSIMNHPCLVEMIIVATNKIILASLRGMNNPVFRHFAVPAFATMEEAVEYARGRVAGANSG